ncbi:MerR family transcriptional regulator [Amycolatopsis sp. NPDC059090]|uniref:MerR family transcriptional regulator n=1 Tax=unclassified Amycolatopsis TaxID=2618356 RepID=UPI003670EC0E
MTDLLAIGAFARLARLSPKALRLYDETNLLPPARVDPDTGYRWYSPGQLDRARRVVQLRGLEMPLPRIRAVLDLPPDAAAAEVRAYWEEQERAWHGKRELAGFFLDQLAGKETPMYDVSVREMPARTLLVTSEHLTADRIGEFAAPLFAFFGGPAVPRPEGSAGRPFLRYHGEISNDSDGLVEFCCPIDPEGGDIAFPEMTLSTDDAGREAYVTVPKANMMTALGAESLHRWLAGHDVEADWKPRQIFLCDPGAAALDDPVFELAVRLR